MQLIQPITKRYLSIEVPLGAIISAGNRVQFNFNPDVQTGMIYAIQAFSVADWATSPSGAAVVSTAGLASLLLTLVIGENEEVQQMPISDLRSANVNGFIRLFDNKKVNLVKSYISIVSTTGLAANNSLMLGLHYQY